ncbi:hypothetical protein [Actinomadura madurae]|uniref:hypothetical protein n=1 Tax=Actinomadura madurae TaxID=1993 RepID=UPI003555ED31
MAFQPVVDAAAVQPADRTVVAGRLTGVEQLPALVQVRPDRQDQVLRPVGDLRVGRVPEEGLHRIVGRVLGQAVVAELPDDGLEVLQDAEIVRDAVLVDVPDERPVLGGLDEVGVLRGIAGLVRPGRVRRVDAGVVLVRDDQDIGLVPVAHRVGEVPALDLPVALPSGEPHLDLVTRTLPPDLAAVLGVVGVVLVPEALATAPFAQVPVTRPAAVDPVAQLLVPQRSADHGRDLLRRAVGRAERVRLEVGRGAPDRRDRLVRRARGVPDRQRERQVLLELLLDQRLVVRELEVAAAVARLPRVVRVLVRGGGAGRHLRRDRQGAVGVVREAVGLAVRGVELRAELGRVAGDGRVVDVAEERVVDRVVRAAGEGLPADAVQQQLRRRVVVDQVGRPEPLVEADLRRRLGLGRRSRPR